MTRDYRIKSHNVAKMTKFNYQVNPVSAKQLELLNKERQEYFNLIEENKKKNKDHVLYLKQENKELKKLREDLLNQKKEQKVQPEVGFNKQESLSHWLKVLNDF